MPDVHCRDAIDDAGRACGGRRGVAGSNPASWWPFGRHGCPIPVVPRVSAVERVSGCQPLPS
jgi:hypothetical protein